MSLIEYEPADEELVVGDTSFIYLFASAGSLLLVFLHYACLSWYICGQDCVCVFRSESQNMQFSKTDLKNDHIHHCFTSVSVSLSAEYATDIFLSRCVILRLDKRITAVLTHKKPPLISV